MSPVVTTPGSLCGPTVFPDGAVRRCRLLLAEARIADITEPGPADIDVGPSALIAPGLIDCQINGAFGHDFTGDPTSIAAVSAQLPASGVTAYLPTIISSDVATMRAADKTLDRPVRGAQPLGLHLEGPVISPERRGAHPSDPMMPERDFVDALSELAHIAVVTFAPEHDRHHRLLDAVIASGSVAAIGHTDASYAQATAALDRGTRLVTHVFNTMAPFHHREPGPVGALFDHSTAIGSVIADGAHLHDATLNLLWSMLAPSGHVVIVSDAMAAAGLGDGQFRLGDVDVSVIDGVVRNSEGVLAGSAALLVDGVRNCANVVGEPLASVWARTTRSSADLLGLPERGRIAPDKRADLVVVGPGGEVAMTMVGGEVVHQDW